MNVMATLWPQNTFKISQESEDRGATFLDCKPACAGCTVKTQQNPGNFCYLKYLLYMLLEKITLEITELA
jgi:hypothetical protein